MESTAKEKESMQASASGKKNLPPSYAEALTLSSSKKYDKALLIIQLSSSLYDAKRPLIQLLKQMNFMEIVFTIDSSQFKDIQTLSDNVFEDFRQKVEVKLTSNAVVFVYIHGTTTCVRNVDQTQKFMGAIAVNRADSDGMVYLLAHDLHKLLAELETKFLTIFLDGHFDSTLHSELIKERESQKDLTKSFVTSWEDIWTALVPPDSRVILFTTYPGIHRNEACSCINLHDNIAAVLDKWIKSSAPHQGSHREFYEAVSYNLYQNRILSKGYLMIQGDKERQFCGRDCFPYKHWVAGNLPTLSESPQSLLDNIVVVVGSLLEFKQNEEVIIFHLLQPMIRCSGIVANASEQCCLVKLSDKGSSPIRNLVQDITKDKSLDICHHFLCVRKMPKSLIKFPVLICITDQEIADDLTNSVSKTSLLRVAIEKDKEKMIVVREEIDRHNVKQYLIVDLERDVIQVKVSTNNSHRLKVVLQDIAWLKYVKRLKSKATGLTKVNYTCDASSERPLLDPNFIAHKIDIRASSELSPEYCASQCVLQFTQPGRYWKPAVHDDCHLDIMLPFNHKFTAIQLRGDAQYEQYVEHLDFMGQIMESQEAELEPSGQVVVETMSGGTKSIAAKEVVLSLLNCEEFAECKFRFMQKLGKEMEAVGDLNVDSFDRPQANCHQIMDGWIEVIMDNDPTPTFTMEISFKYTVFLKHLQFEGKRRNSTSDCKAKLTLKYISDWRVESMEGCSSVWPCKRELSIPMKAARVRIRPTRYHNLPALQLQLYGNPVCEGKAIEVFEREQVTFYFCNEMDKGLFFNVLCLEETGSIEMLLSEYVDPGLSKKRIMEVFIREGHECTNTIDNYKIYVSQRKPVLDTLLQDSLLDYNKPASYSVYSFGSPVQLDTVTKDPWAITDIPIHIKSRKYKS